MNEMYGLIGGETQSFLSYKGQVLVHWDKEDLQFLFPDTKVRKINTLPDNWMHVGNHPQLKGIVEFPLERSEFYED